MKASRIRQALVAAAMYCCLSAAAFPQPGWTPGSEIVGQPVRVTTNGVADTLMLSPDGQATIRSPNGSTVVNATWTAVNDHLCLSAGGPPECIPYATPFQAGQPVIVTSSCGAIETWVAIATNAPAAISLPSPPPPEAAGERGR